MAMDANKLEDLIINKLEDAGFKTSGKHAYAKVMVNAVAEAVVEHISNQAEVSVTSGSSAGIYKVS
jgi:phage replication-related protein YjqB (UPF0714/DUF867 family)